MKIATNFILILFPILFLLWCSIAQSQQHPQSRKPAKNIEIGHENPQPKTEDTKETPVPNHSSKEKIGKLVSTPINTHPKQSDGKGKEKKWVDKLFDDPTAIFTAGLFVVTLGLWLATVLLVVIAKKTSNRQLRAYIFAKPDNPVLFDFSEALRVPIIVKNFGQTPAHELISALIIGLYTYPLDIMLDLPAFDHMASKSPLAPGEQVTQYADLPDRLNKSEIDIIENGKAAIFISGELLYRDAFKRRRRTKFCLYSTGNAFKCGQFAYYPEGNEAN